MSKPVEYRNPKPKMVKFTKKQFDQMFPNDATCLEWLRNRLYPEGVYCEKCEAVTKHHRVKSRPSYSCDHCGHHVHPTAGTIFHKSPTPLTTWFYAIYLMASTRCGISAKQIERETGVTYKTAWRMFKQIRSMLNDEPPFSGPGTYNGKLTRKIEVDEAYFGGRRKGGGGRPMRGDTDAKVTVVGVAQRQGRVKAVLAEDAKASTLKGIVKEHVLPGAIVFTDEWVGYNDLRNLGYQHHRINHSAKIYVAGDVHTNTIEGFWSLVKSGIRGVYHQVGRNYLQTYLNEYSFRYNRRFDTQPMFTSFLHQIEKRETVAYRAPVPVEVEPF
ncbi:MAG: IS1595 family transposase [Terriglobales bacterium]